MGMVVLVPNGDQTFALPSCGSHHELKASPIGQTYRCEERISMVCCGRNLSGGSIRPVSSLGLQTTSDRSIASTDIHIYVDDGRSTARNQETVWLASSKFSKVASYLGMQDALLKCWCLSQTPDDWFGVCASTTADGVFKSVSLERWNKMKTKLRAIWDELMESTRGDLMGGTDGCTSSCCNRTMAIWSIS